MASNSAKLVDSGVNFTATLIYVIRKFFFCFSKSTAMLRARDGEVAKFFSEAVVFVMAPVPVLPYCIASNFLRRT
jgi:hypothetical protein